MKSSMQVQIKQAIAKIHEKGSGDFESLLREVNKAHKLVKLNLPQLAVHRARTRNTFCEWGRGTGKTTIIADRTKQTVEGMPRSTGLLIGPSYQMILTRIMPSLSQGLEMFGLYKNLHYFVGQKPPRNWRRTWGTAYQPPDKFDRCISFYNGTIYHLISQDVKGDGRGLNADSKIEDEAALLDPRKLQEDTDPTLRGSKPSAFKHHHLFRSGLSTSSTPLTPEGRWFIDKELLCVERPEKNLFISATCEFNKANLGDGYLEDARESAYAKWVYEAEYLNIRPSFSVNGFYAQLKKDKHGYKTDSSTYSLQNTVLDCRYDDDLISTQGIILGVDWGAAINCLTANQYNATQNEYRTLKDMYALGSRQEIQDDLFKEFIRYYGPHKTKTVFLHYDNTGNVQTGITRQTRAELAAKQLRDAGWNVRLMTIGGSNPSHEDKYILWENILKEEDPRLPRYRYNIDNCHTLATSMMNAKTKHDSQGRVHKDKSSEKSKVIKREHATDLSDANDTPIYNMFKSLIQRLGATLPPSKISK